MYRVRGEVHGGRSEKIETVPDDRLPGNYGAESLLRMRAYTRRIGIQGGGKNKMTKKFYPVLLERTPIELQVLALKVEIDILSALKDKNFDSRVKEDRALIIEIQKGVK